MQSMLRSLAAMQHVLAVVLTLTCLGRALSAGVRPVTVTLLTVAFLVLSGIGLAMGRRPHGGDARDVRAAACDVDEQRSWPWRPRVPPLWGLGALTACWLLMVLVAPQMVWVAFVLWLLAGHLLSWRGAVPYTVGTLAVVVILPWMAAGVVSFAEIVGPTVGAVFAVVVSRGQVEIARVAIERERLIERLVAAQEEAESLHSELAAAQREAGASAERARLSRDIHDTLAQGFSSIVLLTRSAASVPDSDLHAVLDQVGQTAADNLAEAREVVHALAPHDLDAGLPATLRRLTEAFTGATGVRCELRVEGDVRGLPTAVEVALVRTVQGALANVRRHAHASRAVVTLADAGDVLRLDVVDDGAGFDVAATARRPASPAAGGYGLASTRARLRELGGGLDIESSPGEGTALSAFVPVGGPPR